MKTKRGFAQFAAASGLALLLSAPAFAAPQVSSTVEYRTDRISSQGTITGINREGDMFRITLNRGEYSYLVPNTMVNGRDLRIGTQVRIDGIVDGDNVNANMIAISGEPYYVHDPYYRSVPYGQSGWLSGTVERTDRHLGFVVLRDDETGNLLHVDVRHMNLRRPINVWGLRAGDHISINGSWEKANHEQFDARLIQY